MINARRLSVHLVPELVQPSELDGDLVVVIDVLRATTTFVHALAAGCRAILPVGSVEEALEVQRNHLDDQPILFGERHGRAPEGFDLGNSPHEFSFERCCNRWAVATTTNGTRALLHSRNARRILLGAFVNYSAVCAEIEEEIGAVHLVCAGSNGTLALEDVLCAGAMVEALMCRGAFVPNDSARVAWDAFDRHGQCLLTALDLCEHGRRLKDMGLGDDVVAAAELDRFSLIPEATGDDLTVVVAGIRLECDRR
jgi:2-phosphosulfolactate phosphatase